MKVNALDSFAAGYKWCTAPANLTSEQSPPEPGNVPRNWGKALEDWGPSGKFSKLFEQAPSLGKKRRIFTCPIQKKFLEK